MPLIRINQALPFFADVRRAVTMMLVAVAAFGQPAFAEKNSFQDLALETAATCGNPMLSLSARRSAVIASGWTELDPVARAPAAAAVAEGSVVVDWKVARKVYDDPLAKEVKRRKHLASFTTGMFGGIGWFESTKAGKTAYLFLQPYAYPKPISLVVCEMVFPQAVDISKYAESEGGWNGFERGPLGDLVAISNKNPHALALFQQSIGPKRFLKATGQETVFRTYVRASIFSLINEP